jgi:hypothetical protein
VARADGKRQLGSPSGRHEDAGNFWLVEQLLAAKEGLCSMQLDSYGFCLFTWTFRLG